MKTPLLAVASTQNSALSWKSPYSCFETRKPLPRSACTMPPSRSRQLALPMGSQLLRFEPSNSVVHPVCAACPEALCACQSTAEPARMSPMAMADRRFLFSPVGAWVEYFNGRGWEMADLVVGGCPVFFGPPPAIRG